MKAVALGLLFATLLALAIALTIKTTRGGQADVADGVKDKRWRSNLNKNLRIQSHVESAMDVDPSSDEDVEMTDEVPLRRSKRGKAVERRDYSPGYIYLVTNPAWSQWTKVGKAVNRQSRLNSYQTDSPERDYVMKKAFVVVARQTAKIPGEAILEEAEKAVFNAYKKKSGIGGGTYTWDHEWIKRAYSVNDMNQLLNAANDQLEDYSEDKDYRLELEVTDVAVTELNPESEPERPVALGPDDKLANRGYVYAIVNPAWNAVKVGITKNSRKTLKDSRYDTDSPLRDYEVKTWAVSVDRFFMEEWLHYNLHQEDDLIVNFEWVFSTVDADLDQAGILELVEAKFELYKSTHEEDMTITYF